MSDYNKRRVTFYNDKTRMKSVYSKDIINSINEKDYKDQSNRGRLDMALYDYSHDEGLISTVLDGSKKNEETIRKRL